VIFVVKPSGNNPVSLLSLTSSFSSPLKLTNCVGSVPENLLSPMAISLRLVISPMTVGIVPESFTPGARSNSSLCSFCSNAICVGSVPEMRVFSSPSSCCVIASGHTEEGAQSSGTMNRTG